MTKIYISQTMKRANDTNASHSDTVETHASRLRSPSLSLAAQVNGWSLIFGVFMLKFVVPIYFWLAMCLKNLLYSS